MKKQIATLIMGISILGFMTSCGEQEENESINKTPEQIEETSDLEETPTPEETQAPEESLPTSPNAISFKDLSNGEEFGLGDTWNLTLNEIEEETGMKLEALSELDNIKNYRMPEDVYLVEAEREATMGMQFIDDKMQMIALSVKESDSDMREQLYQKFGSELKNLYGDPDSSVTKNDIGESLLWKSESGEAVTLLMCENNGKTEEVCVAIHIVP